MIRQNKNIIGISIGETEHKISQYADGTEIMLKGDNNSFETTIKTIDAIGKISGLFLNAGKTSAIWLGSARNSHDFTCHVKAGLCVTSRRGCV